MFFTNSGSEAVDTALKIALAYHNIRGEGGRQRLVGRERGFHGASFGGLAVGGEAANRKLFGSLLAGIDRLPSTYNRAKQAFTKGEPEWGAHLALELERIAGLHDASTIAAVIVLSQNQAKNPNETVNMPSSVTYIDLHFATDSTMVIFPEVLHDAAQKGISWKNDISVSMASVVFTPIPPTCTSNCTYITNVVWSSGPNKRTCGVLLTSAADTAAPSKTTLPADVFPAGAPPGGSIIVVDIVYNYTPIFGLSLFGTIPIARSAYIAPRNALPAATPYIRYDPVSGDDGIGAECPGY